jgi:hypothetical protein
MLGGGGDTINKKATKIQNFMKKHLISKYFTLDERIKYYHYVQKYLKGIKKQSCLQPKKFGDQNGFNIAGIIDLEKKIGSASVYGVIYKTSVKDMLGRFPIASKLAAMDTDGDNTKEIELNVAFSNYIVVKQKLSRHFLLCYKSFQCYQMKNSKFLPNIIRNKRYHISINELAQGDLWGLCKKGNAYNKTFLQEGELVLNIILQCQLGVATFHKLGWVHQDCHGGNFLYQVTENKSGYFHYLILGKNYYMKNCGYNMMIYDFGLAEEYSSGKRPHYYYHYDNQFNNKMYEQENDTNRPFIYDYYDYRNMMRTFWVEFCYNHLSPQIKPFVQSVMRLSQPNAFNNENELISALCELFVNRCPYQNLFTDKLPPGEKIINDKPFIIDDSIKRFLPQTLSITTPKLLSPTIPLLSPKLKLTSPGDASPKALSVQSVQSKNSIMSGIDDISDGDNEDDDDDDDDDDGDKEGPTSTADCIRNRSNFSIVKPSHMIDKKEFDPDFLNMYINNDASPKLKLLLKNIQKLDAKDLRTTGKQFKHIIFTDVNRSAYGAKIIASALAANGMQIVQHPQGTGFTMYPDDKLLETKGNNFAVLISKAFYDRPLNVKTRKLIMERFNSRPDNVYGNLIRFIVLDQGFKEGIDLYDVKYVHLFEPLAVPADEKQAIGRGTRFCGQKGLEFHPKFGWPLYVFKYDVAIPQNLQARYGDVDRLFNLYIKHSNIDLKKIVFASELESASIEASVDYNLNKKIHTFAIDKPSRILSPESVIGSIGGSPSNSNKPPPKKMNFEKMREYIRDRFSNFSYSDITVENKCIDGSETLEENANKSNASIVSFTHTQDFVRHYFQPSSAYKGILFWHSVGTGKTCSAIATATTSFDMQGYTILWVTRHTLKADIWKNMYKQVCSIDVQNRIKNGLVLPKKVRNTQHISKNWLEPISYKQFSNMLLKRNKIYNEMVRRNGAEDPLKKTLLIIDEAHKLYSPTVAKNEKPDTNILEKMIHKSYEKSGEDSVRVLLMTATPFTEDGMEMMKLLNLLRDDDALDTDFELFSGRYLDDEGHFTERGRKKFQDEISGYVSYLNRSQDARNFAHPVIENISAIMSVEKTDQEKPVSKYDAVLRELRENAKVVREMLKELNKTKKEDAKNLKEVAQQKFKECEENAKKWFESYLAIEKTIKEQKENQCKELPVKERKGCKEQATAAYKSVEEKLKAEKAAELKKCQEIKKTLGNISNLNEKISDLKKDGKEYRQQIKEVRENKKARNAEIKAVRTQSKMYQADMKKGAQESKQLAMVIKERLAKIKKIADKKERQTAIKNFRRDDRNVLRVKELKKLSKDLRSKITANNNKILNMHLIDGKKRLNKISQEFALAKYCRV